MTAFQYQRIINKYLKEHNIKVEGYYKRSHGLAWIEERIIRIPKPVIELNFYICLHEIGHVVTNDITDSDWLGEYKATKYGIEEARKWGVEYSKEVMECIRGYLKYHLVKAIQTGIAIETIPDKVFRLAGASKRYWLKKYRKERNLIMVMSMLMNFRNGVPIK
jgi:HEPN domain-containing protein